MSTYLPKIVFKYATSVVYILLFQLTSLLLKSVHANQWFLIIATNFVGIHFQNSGDLIKKKLYCILIFRTKSSGNCRQFNCSQCKCRQIFWIHKDFKAPLRVASKTRYAGQRWLRNTMHDSVVWLASHIKEVQECRGSSDHRNVLKFSS